MKKSLLEILKELSEYTSLKEKEIYSRVQGKVKIISLDNSKITVADINNNTVTHDSSGRVFTAGECVLFPNSEYLDWEKYLKETIIKFKEQKLRLGSICLVKNAYESPWTLAVFERKENNKYIAKTGRDSEIFEYCIVYEDNAIYLGRVAFPDWLYDEEETEEEEI